MNQDAASIRRETDRENPWPGLAPYEEGDGEYFHGRDTSIADVVRVILREDLSLLFGLSGLGKTSLLRAGVFPALRAMHVFPVYIRLGAWRGDESARDATASSAPDSLWPLVFQEIERAAAKWGYDVPAPAPSGTAWEYFRRGPERFWGRGDTLTTPLLVFDQFEEVFNRDAAGAIPPEVLTTFLRELSETVSGSMPKTLVDRQADAGDYLHGAGVCKVIFSFREDFLAHVAGLEALFPSIGRNSYRLGPLSTDDAVAAVTAAGGHLIEGETADERRSLANEIVGMVRGTRVGAVARSSDSVDPALLSLFCRELNEKRKAKKAAVIDAALVRSSEAARILTDFYESCMKQVSEPARRFVERELILEESKSRESAAEETALKAGLTQKELEFLIEKRILRREESTRQGLPRIELTHDVLVEPTLASKLRRDAADQRSQRWRRLIGIAGIVFVLMVGLGYVVVVRAREASARDEQFRLSRLFVSGQWKETDPTRAALVLSEIKGNNDSLSWRSTLLRTLSQPLAYLELKQDTPLTWVDIAQDGTRILTSAEDGSSRIWSLDGGPPVKIDGRSRILRAHFDPKGDQIVTSSLDGQVRLWTVRGEPVAELRHPPGVVASSLAFNPSGSLLVTGAFDGTVRLWRRGSTSPDFLIPLASHDAIVSLTFDPTGAYLLAANEKGLVHVWNVVEDRARLHGQCSILSGKKNVLTKPIDVWFSEPSFLERVLAQNERAIAQRRLAAGSSRIGVRVVAIDGAQGWFPLEALVNGRPCSLQHQPPPYDYAVRKILASADDEPVVVESLASQWSTVQNLQVRRAAHGSNDRVESSLPAAPVQAATAAAFLPSALAVGFDDGSVRVWTGEAYGQLLVLAGHTKPIAQIAHNRALSILVTRSEDPVARVWRLDSEGRPHGDPSVRLPSSGSVHSVAVSPDGKSVLTTVQGGSAYLWTIDGRRQRRLFQGDVGVRQGAFSPAGSDVLTLDNQGILRVWLDATGAAQEIVSVTGDGQMTGAAFSPDGSRILTTSATAVRLVDARTLATATTIFEATDKLQPTFATLSPSGDLVLFGTSDGVAHVRRTIDRGPDIVTLQSDSVCKPAGGSFSPDGMMVLAACAKGDRARLWRLSSPGTFQEFVHPEIVSATFSPKGRYVATADENGKIRLRPVQTPGAEPLVLTHGEGRVSVAFSRDESLLVSTGEDGKALLWQTDEIEAPSQIASQKRKLTSAVFGPSDNHVVVGSLDGTTLIVTIDPDLLLESIRKRTRVCLPLEFRVNELAEDPKTAAEKVRECESRSPER